MVVEEKKDPNWVRKPKGVAHPAEKKKAFRFCVFNKGAAAQEGVRVKERSPLDEHSDLIL